jgi:hypothetical protein
MVKAASLIALLFVSGSSAFTQAQDWEPSPGHAQLPIWQSTVPDAQPGPGLEMMKIDSDFFVAGRRVTGVLNVTQPTMTVYAPRERLLARRPSCFPVVASKDWRSTLRARRFATG